MSDPSAHRQAVESNLVSFGYVEPITSPTVANDCEVLLMDQTRYRPVDGTLVDLERCRVGHRRHDYLSQIRCAA
jgi:hypothetical protein